MTDNLQRHHYIPRFYLTYWAQKNQRLVEYSRPFKEVRPKRRHPNETGFVDGLFEIQKAPFGMRNILETGYFQQVDGRAAPILEQMVTSDTIPLLTDSRRAWSLFAVSLVFRSPEALETIRQQILEHTKYVIKQKHELDISSEGEQELRQSLLVQGILGFNLIEHIKTISIRRDLDRSIWRVIDLSNCKPGLLTSDRPVLIDALDIKGRHIAMPISPAKVFIAGEDELTMRRIKRLSSSQLMFRLNNASVRRAAKYVYFCDDSQLSFVGDRFGQQPRRLMPF